MYATHQPQPQMWLWLCALYRAGIQGSHETDNTLQLTYQQHATAETQPYNRKAPPLGKPVQAPHPPTSWGACCWWICPRHQGHPLV